MYLSGSGLVNIHILLLYIYITSFNSPTEVESLQRNEAKMTRTVRQRVLAVAGHGGLLGKLRGRRQRATAAASAGRPAWWPTCPPSSIRYSQSDIALLFRRVVKPSAVSICWKFHFFLCEAIELQCCQCRAREFLRKFPSQDLYH